MIQKSEFLHKRWMEDGKEENAPNILKYINQFNDVTISLFIKIEEKLTLKKQITNWFATSIIQQKDIKNRVKVLCHILDIFTVILLFTILSQFI